MNNTQNKPIINLDTPLIKAINNRCIGMCTKKIRSIKAHQLFKKGIVDARYVVKKELQIDSLWN